jgi:hypothetical protein
MSNKSRPVAVGREVTALEADRLGLPSRFTAINAGTISAQRKNAAEEI